eukprot:gnl/TRDRNA2_/TRDRNA2_174686_c0_seq2.p1 gnl/TRDRNA2_/TRDRNA2_174686_c0~~gnl/TRDRNA2_/TRDRNA2_174686_c0_seq2.p1  ORF type:complete len:152 (-),score=12.94 gnl/TRDRNA2_/TRDRNA2_174686_c0_seq2:90-545(-)
MMKFLGRTDETARESYRPIYLYIPTTRAELMKTGQGVSRFILGEDKDKVEVHGFITKQDAEQQVTTLPTYSQLKNAPHLKWLRLGGAIELYIDRHKDSPPMRIPFGAAIWITSMDAINGWGGQITIWTDSPQAHVEGYIDEATARKLVTAL